MCTHSSMEGPFTTDSDILTMRFMFGTLAVAFSPSLLLLSVAVAIVIVLLSWCAVVVVVVVRCVLLLVSLLLLWLVLLLVRVSVGSLFWQRYHRVASSSFPQ